MCTQTDLNNLIGVNQVVSNKLILSILNDSDRNAWKNLVNKKNNSLLNSANVLLNVWGINYRVIFYSYKGAFNKLDKWQFKAV